MKIFFSAIFLKFGKEQIFLCEELFCFMLREKFRRKGFFDFNQQTCTSIKKKKKKSIFT